MTIDEKAVEKERPVKQSMPSPIDKLFIMSAKRKEPNKTEAEYGRHLSLEFPGAKVRFEPITLHLDNGHSYTPDHGVFLLSGEILLVEEKSRGKNGFRLPSYQRAKLAFDQARIEYPFFKWRWSEKQSGKWNVTNY